MPPLLTTRDVAALLGVDEWRVRRVYEDGTLPEPSRLGGIRVLTGADLPAIIDALRDRGWLRAAEVGQ